MKTIKKRIKEFTNHPPTVLEERVNSTDVSIIGVVHDLDYFKKYRQFFENKISESTTIMIEGLHKEFWEYEEGDELFFNRIGEIAHSQNKKIYQADPRHSMDQSLDILLSMEGAFLVLEGLLGLIKHYPLEYNFTFLGIGLPLLLGSMYTKIGRVGYSCIKNKLIKYTLTDAISYGRTDYRDLKIAEGIDKICNKIEGIEKLTCIHGKAHSHPIMAYLKKPKLRKIKKVFYLPLSLILPRKVKEYTPVINYPGWKLTKKL